MKSTKEDLDAFLAEVTLSVRVWIEISMAWSSYTKVNVTLSVRVWIEISQSKTTPTTSLVTLSVRVWIEITKGVTCTAQDLGHPQCEGVD